MKPIWISVVSTAFAAIILLFSHGRHGCTNRNSMRVCDTVPMSRHSIPTNGSTCDEHQSESLTTGTSCETPRIISQAALVERVTNTDDGYISVSIDNSHIVIETTEIKALVAKGRGLIPYLTEVMEDYSISFDTFARCYSVCAQIVQKYDREANLPWTGGADVVKTKSGTVRLITGGQMDEERFRKMIVQGIKQQYNLSK